MRLIDADKIRYSDLSDGRVPEGVWCTWKDRIDAMPIVEAIPIEWLKKKCEEADNMGMGIDDWSVKDCYELVLADWEKEKQS